MRDKYKDEEYFEIYIQEAFKSIEFLNNALKERQSDLDRRRRVIGGIEQDYSDLIKAQYSYGKDLYKIEEYYNNYVPMLLEIWGKGGSILEIYDSLALSVLLQTKQNLWEIPLDLAKKYGREDAITNLYERYLRDHVIEVKGKSSFGRHYDKLLDIISNSENIAESLVVYLRRDWYRGNKGMYWYGRHKNNQFNTYNGYWSLEAAAVAKMCNIDDTILKDKPYYPYDLVHYKEIVG